MSSDPQSLPRMMWVPDKKEVWRLSEVLRLTSTHVEIPTTGNESPSSSQQFVASSSPPRPPTTTLPLQDVHAWNPSHSVLLHDMALIDDLHEAPLLWSLRKRFEKDDIYTYFGNVLVAVNPYRAIEGLYDKSTYAARDDPSDSDSDSDADADSDGSSPLSSSPSPSPSPRPHVYAVAARALSALRSSASAQSVIIAGESGSGKTEASKHVLRHLVDECEALGIAGDARLLRDSRVLQDRVLESNVVLESFGNAKTARNDNSSRFGKYIRLKYDGRSGGILGAETEHFLLEKSRLVHVEKGERNYHIFYQLCAAAIARDPDVPPSLSSLSCASSYRSLSMGGCLEASGDVDDRLAFKATCRALETLGVDAGCRDDIFRALAALLQLGNVDFEERLRAGGRLDDGEGVKTKFREGSGVTIASVAAALGVKAEDFERRLTTKETTSGRGSVITMPLDERGARENVNGLVKFVYGAIFDKIVRMVNEAHRGDSEDKTDAKAPFIGILDIFGFEVFKKNSFEQLCINFANEQLQQQFNRQIFVLEKQTYDAEGIDSSVIEFRDNQSVIDLMMSAKPPGLFPTLEEHCLMSRKPDNKALLSVYMRSYASHVNFAKPKFGEDSFVVNHFAGSVEYAIADFIEKNNDSLCDDLVSLVLYSSNGFLSSAVKGVVTGGEDDAVESDEVFAALQEGESSSRTGGPAARRAPARHSAKVGGGSASSDSKTLLGLSTVSFTFRSQLDDLMRTLYATSPHYIKCIKPNNAKAPGGFSNALVIEQLRYSGALEVVRIRREAYPSRLTFALFHNKYELLLGDCPGGRVLTSLEASRAICERYLRPGDYQLGRTYVFLKDNILRVLAAALKQFLDVQATKINANARSFLEKKRFEKARNAASKLEAVARMLKQKRHFKEEKAMMVKVQSIVRGTMERKGYAVKLRKEAERKQAETELKEAAAASRIAATRRMVQQHKEYLHIIEAAKHIEATFRMHKEKKEYREDKRKTVAIQAAMRGYMQRKGLTEKLHSAARIQLAARSFLRNLRLQRAVENLHLAAARGDADRFSELLSSEPGLKNIRLRCDSFKTILHTICGTGSLRMAALLDISLCDIMAVDAKGNNSLHFAANAARIDLVKYLCDSVNTAATIAGGGAKVGLKQAQRLLNSENSVKGMATEKLLEGWMRKYHGNNKPKVRWCILTKNELLYFKRKSDKTPKKTVKLESAMVKPTSTERGFTFEVHSPLLLDKKNQLGRLYFTCESELEKQKWLAALRRSDAVSEATVSSAKVAKKKLVNLEARRAFVRRTNKAGETALHMLATYEPTPGTDSVRLTVAKSTASAVSAVNAKSPMKRAGTSRTMQSASRTVTVASYLIEAGCDVDLKDNTGRSACKAAAEVDNMDLVAALVNRGANIAMKDSGGQSAIDLLSSSEVDRICRVGRIGLGDLPSLKKAPTKVENCTYLSIFFDKLSSSHNAELVDPYLKISVFSKKTPNSGELNLAEIPQAIPQPIVSCPEYLYFGATWHMQSPLEDVSNACAVFELCKKSNGECMSWCEISLDPRGASGIDSGERQLELHMGPPLHKGPSDHRKSLVSADMFLSISMLLTVKEGL